MRGVPRLFSVTQQFNTTTSMGRLTLNVLLSFAQFEREVIGERIRDKIAASKRKGMWMGGVPPLGYRGQDRKLVIIDSEAEIVRSIFRRYAELGSVQLLRAELEARGINSKSWTSVSGRVIGGKPFSRGAPDQGAPVQCHASRQRWRAVCRTGQEGRREPILFHAARPAQLSRPGYHRGHPRRPSAARSDRRQAAGTFMSATWLARAADRAWHCLSRTELEPVTSRSLAATRARLAHHCDHGRRTRFSRRCGTGKAPDRDVTGSWRDIDEPCVSLRPCRLGGPAHTAVTAGFSIQER